MVRWFTATLFLSMTLDGVLGIEEKYKELLLKLHNKARANEGASNMNQLVWDYQLESEAAAWNDRCVFKHQHKGRGENLAWSSFKNPEEELIQTAFKNWFDEKKDYTYGQYSCGSTGSCHYTQQVWHSTRRIGCAHKRCDYLGGATANSWYLVCFYDPKGNTMGEKPYEFGTACSKCRDDQQCEEKLCAGGEDPCEDLNAYCDTWVAGNQCTNNKVYMAKNCPKACGFCKGGVKPTQGGTKTTTGGTKPTTGGNKCEDKSRSCPTWAKGSGCSRNPGYMYENCAKSCGKCNGDKETSTGGNKCEDKSRSCPTWAKGSGCSRNPGYMYKNCAKSCGKCKGGKEPSTGDNCEDKSRSCSAWAKQSECNRNPGYMHKNCAKSCGKCGGGGTESDKCVDKSRSCSRWAKRDECRKNPGYMKRKCPKSCKLCAGGGSGTTEERKCTDAKYRCAGWAKNNQCYRNPSYMYRYCRKSCNVC